MPPSLGSQQMSGPVTYPAVPAAIAAVDIYALNCYLFSAQSSSPDGALPTNVSSYLHCCFGKEGYIKQTKLENQSAQKVILQVSEMYTYSYFGQSFYFAVKDGTKIQSGLCNCHVLFPAEAGFELWNISGVLGLGCRKPCASWPAKQPAGSRWVRNQVHAFFST